MGKDYPNFYENMEEAHRRLLNTVVLYDKEPCKVITICNNREDKIFRVYLWPIKEDPRLHRFPDYSAFINGTAEQAAYIDKWMKEHPDVPIMRKMMNSPAFNRFRPFPLGMYQINGNVYYLERQPIRQREQGLIRNQVTQTRVSLDTEVKTSAFGNALSGEEFYNCVVGSHPTAKECILALRNPEIVNQAAAFHRNFAFVRGPLDIVFLAYKTEIIGYVPKDGDGINVVLGNKYSHYREVAQESGAFDSIIIN